MTDSPQTTDGAGGVSPDDEKFDWLFNELVMTAERSRDHGLTPVEFYFGLRAYLQTFEADYADAIADADTDTTLLTDDTEHGE